MTTFPRRSALEMLWPSSVPSLAIGAASPVCSPRANAAPLSTASHARNAPRPFRNVRRGSACRARESEGISDPRTSGPTREQLDTVEVAVHRQLHEAKDLQPGGDLRGDARAHIRHDARGVLNVRQ